MEKQKERRMNREHPITDTWFWRYVVDNKFVSVILIAMLLFLTIFIFSEISHLFTFVGQILSIIGSPIVFGVLFYYLLKPMVDSLESKGVPRKIAILLVFIGIILVIALAITFLIPGIQRQVEALVENFPDIWNSVLAQVQELMNTEWSAQIYRELQATNILERVSAHITNLFTVTLDSIGSLFGGIARIAVTIVTMPFVLYYLLADRERFKQGLMNLTPTRARPVVSKLMTQISYQIGSYVRGELLVALAVSIMFYIGYRLIGLDYALVLSILAGVLNLIPYLGSILASVPALVIGAFISPWKLVQVMIVLMVEQTIEGRVVSPQILGNRLDIHPLVILFILLVSGSLFGFMGLILAVPGFGVLRVFWNLFFEWIKYNYDFYDEEEVNQQAVEDEG